MVTVFDHRELCALQGLPWRTQLVYMHGIKPYMDSKSGVVGLRRGISYQSISECLFVEPAQGRERYVRPTDRALKISIDQLVDVGLLEVVPAERRLVFRCVLAMEHKSVQKKDVGFTSDMRRTNDVVAEAASVKGVAGGLGKTYPQAEMQNDVVPLMSNSNKTYNSVVAVGSNTPRAHVDRSALINALAAARDGSGCSLFRPEKIYTPRVQRMVDDWVAAGVSVDAVRQSVAMVLARGVRLNSPAYLDNVVRDFADEQSGAAESRRSALRVPRDDGALEGWAVEHGFSRPGRLDSYADYRGKLSRELAAKLRELN